MGRLPRTCDACRPPGLRRAGDRHNARRIAERDGERRQLTAEEQHQATQLAIGLSLFGDVRKAARWAGIPDVVDLEALERVAREDHKDLIEGDTAGAARRMSAAINMLVADIMYDRAQISPRDKVTAVRQLANAREQMAGEQRSSFASISISVVGADGKAINLGPPP